MPMPRLGALPVLSAKLFFSPDLLFPYAFS